MNKQPDEQTYIKDDSSLFNLIARLTEELPPRVTQEHRTQASHTDSD